MKSIFPSKLQLAMLRINSYDVRNFKKVDAMIYFFNKQGSPILWDTEELHFKFYIVAATSKYEQRRNALIKTLNELQSPE